MKITRLLLGCLLAASVWAAEPSRPAGFEVRLVVSNPSAESEALPVVKSAGPSGRATDERLQVQKKPLLDRSAIRFATVKKSVGAGTSEIRITFNEQGAQRFAAVTRDHKGERLAMVIDGKIYSAPKIATEIPSGQAVITGSFTEQEAHDLVGRLNEAETK